MSRYIDADALMKTLKISDDCKHCEQCEYDYFCSMSADFVSACEAINDAPSIDIVPKRGEWIDMGDFEQCSVCKGTHLKEFQSYYGKTTWVKTPYCPNCGADMRGKDDE